MRFLRILPEIIASTTCWVLSSWTLKNALGCLSIIVPSAGIRSSLANRVSFLSVLIRSLCHLCDLCASVVRTLAEHFTTETRRTLSSRKDSVYCLLLTAYCLLFFTGSRDVA